MLYGEVVRKRNQEKLQEVQYFQPTVSLAARQNPHILTTERVLYDNPLGKSEPRLTIRSTKHFLTEQD